MLKCLLVLLVLVVDLTPIALVYAQEEKIYKSTAEIEADTSRDNMHFAAWQFSFIGEYHKSMVSFDKAVDNFTDQKLEKLPETIKLEPALEYILNLSSSSQIVIINETHHQPLHRVFTESMLQGLYQNGYRYLGLEALAEDSLINIRKYPLQTDGYYTSEPQFGNMLRRALDLGFTVFGYEAEGSGSVREKGQAANIYKRLQRDPDAKIVIHCGFSHVIEGSVPNWGKAMAGELKALSGIDPLTIDQVELTEHSSEKYESEYYIPGSVIKEAVVLIGSQGKPVFLNSDSTQTDLQIMHPRTDYEHERPDWLLRNSFKFFSLKKLLENIKLPCLTAAYPVNEEIESVPMDVIEITDPAKKSLVLPPGDYKLVITDAHKKIATRNITVK
jgi:hypothetical protein